MGTAKRFNPLSINNFSMAIENGTSDPGTRLIIESTIPGLDRELFDTIVRALYERWGGMVVSSSDSIVGGSRVGRGGIVQSEVGGVVV